MVQNHPHVNQKQSLMTLSTNKNSMIFKSPWAYGFWCIQCPINQRTIHKHQLRNQIDPKLPEDNGEAQNQMEWWTVRFPTVKLYLYLT